MNSGYNETMKYDTKDMDQVDDALLKIEQEIKRGKDQNKNERIRQVSYIRSCIIDNFIKQLANISNSDLSKFCIRGNCWWGFV